MCIVYVKGCMAILCLLKTLAVTVLKNLLRSEQLTVPVTPCYFNSVPTTQSVAGLERFANQNPAPDFLHR